ncbi:MAG: DUF3326 domain-containing protein [Planctomycetes bacterium]|nr:DUF3326 domain-containing protein [Planctomycetota bacterium]
MLLIEREINIPQFKGDGSLLAYFEHSVRDHLNDDEIPVRFVITESDDNKYHCELGVLKGVHGTYGGDLHSIFRSIHRGYENPEKFNAVLLVPTGIGAEIGGHSGDAGPIAKLLASVCDNLITHPNVVNAADINELPDNGLYVEGSVITRLLMGTIGLQKVRSNRVMLVIDEHEDKLFHESAVNAVSAARASLGLDCPVVVTMEDKLLMRSLYSSSGRAVGRIDYFERICEILSEYRDKYDAVALSSVIKVPVNFHRDYYLEDLVNPWGGVEAMLTHAISLLFNIPSAHSPMLESREILDLDLGVIDPRKAAEIVSVTFLHSILKGLHRSPRIVLNPLPGMQPGVLTAADIDCLIIPDRCVGIPTLAAIEQGITVIAVKENKNKMKNDLSLYPFKPGKLIYVENYLEAVGIMAAMKAGVAPEAVRRPLSFTNVEQKARFKELKHEYQDKKNAELPIIKDKKAMKL